MINPYMNISGLNTYKGDLHFHSTDSDGKEAPQAMFDRLREQEFDFCCLTDHDLPGDKTRISSGLLVLPGQEMSSKAGHIVSIFSKIEREDDWTIKKQLEAIRKSGGFAILSHPKIREFIVEQGLTYSTKRLLCEFPELYDGIEIYTHNVGSGFKLAIDRLDAIWSSYILTWGALHHRPLVPVWGFASSDGHHTSHITKNVGIVIFADSLTEENIRNSIHAGAFYSLADTQARFTEIDEADGTFHVAADNARMMKVLSTSGIILKTKYYGAAEKAEINYKINGTEGYIRFEAIDSNGNAAYSNPVFIGKFND